MTAAVGLPVENLKESDLTHWREFVSRAHCSRCGGLMVTEQCFDLLDDSGHLYFLAQRCIQCGELVDPVILQNRRLHLAVMQKQSRS